MRFSRIVAITGEGIVAPPKMLKNLSKRARKKRPKLFQEAIEYIKLEGSKKEPNDMHKVLAEYNIPIITRDINKLHQKAGSQKVIELNGNIEDDNLVLFGEELINFQEAWNLIDTLDRLYGEETALIVVGDDKILPISDFIIESIKRDVYVERIPKGEEYKVRDFLEKHQKE